MTDQRIVAMGLLTEQDLERLGAKFDRAWLVNETPCFGAILQAIDDADRALWRQRDADENGKAVPQMIIKPRQS